MRGRPPAWNDFGRLGEGLWTELLPVTSIARVTLPAAVRQRVPFLMGTQSVAALAVLRVTGSARIVPTSPDGTAILDAARIAIERTGQDRDNLILAAMAKYARLSIEPTGRFALPAGLAAHLQAERSAGIRVVVRGGELSLWSEGSWLDAQAARLDDLPG